MRKVAEPILSFAMEEEELQEEENLVMNENVTLSQSSTTLYSEGTYTQPTATSGPTTPKKQIRQHLVETSPTTPNSPINYNNLYRFSSNDTSSQNQLFASQNPYNMGFHFQHMCQQFTRMNQTLERELQILLQNQSTEEMVVDN